MSVLRWGILSCANIAVGKVIPGMRSSTRSEVLAIASRDRARAEATARALGIPRSFGSYEELLADPDVDAVYIPLPNHLHATWAIAAARAGKHVLCEKPLAMTAGEAQAIVDAGQDARVVVMEAFMYRQHPSWVAVGDLVASGRIGPLVAVDSWFSYHLEDPTNIRNIRAVGGGALYDIGCYSVNLSRMLFGDEPRTVAASIVRDPVSGVDILTSALLTFATGTATFTSATRVEPDQRVSIYGTAGRIEIEIPFNIPPDRPSRVFVIAGGDPPVAPAVDTLEFAPADPYGVQADRFAEAVLDGAPVPITGADSVANMRVIERLFEAARLQG